MNYGDLKPHHISMCLVALNSYGSAPFEGRLLKVGAVGALRCQRGWETASEGEEAALVWACGGGGNVALHR